MFLFSRRTQILINKSSLQFLLTYVFKNRSISNNFILVASSSPVKFSKDICRCEVWSCITKTISVSRYKLLEIKLFFRRLSGRIESEKIRNVYSTKIILNTATISGVNSAIDSFSYFKLYGERNTGLRAITALSYKQPNNLLQLQNTQLNLLIVTFNAIKNWLEINLR